jgi:radical SAM superfamily enzyme
MKYEGSIYRPPSEAESLILQVAVGCSYNRCTFCHSFQGKQFRIKSFEEIKEDIDEASTYGRIPRVFLADGDALIYPFAGLMTLLDALATAFPRLTRVGAYASPNSLRHKSSEQLQALRERKLRILYFGLESGDDATLAAIRKGFTAEEMAQQAVKARQAGMKLSVTAILGLAGRDASLQHARATAVWVNQVNPEYFSLLTLFHRHNEAFVRNLTQCTRRELILEARELLTHLKPHHTIMRSNHVSNFLNLAGSYPKDRDRLIRDVDAALAEAARYPGFLDGIPEYEEEYY